MAHQKNWSRVEFTIPRIVLNTAEQYRKELGETYNEFYSNCVIERCKLIHDVKNQIEKSEVKDNVQPIPTEAAESTTEHLPDTTSSISEPVTTTSESA